MIEKNIGKKNYYIIKAVPESKAKTLFIISSFIGNKERASQLIKSVSSPDATSESATVNTLSMKDYNTKADDSQEYLSGSKLVTTTIGLTTSEKTNGSISALISKKKTAPFGKR